MRSVVIIGELACLIAGAAYAGPRDYDQETSGYAFEHPHIYTPWGQPAPVTHLYRSGNECGPDRATPVWSAGNALLGYDCETESANGS